MSNQPHPLIYPLHATQPPINGPPPLPYRSYMHQHSAYATNAAPASQLGPYRLYAQVVRDYLAGRIVTPMAQPANRRTWSNSSMSVFSDPTNHIAGSTIQGLPGFGGQRPPDPCMRGTSRLDLDAANRRQAPTWINASMDMVAIHIKGENGRVDGPPFYVHKDFFLHASPYFGAAFESGFAESKTQTLHFEESNREIFALLIQWVYKQDLNTLATFELEDRKNLPPGVGLSTLQGDQLHEYIEKSQELAFEHTTKLIDLWFLADKVLMPELQNAALIAIESLRFFTPLQGLPADICTAIYAKTQPGSPLRKYLADTTIRRLHPNAQDQGEDFPYEMLIDIFNRVKEAGSDAKLRHYGLSERAMESFLVDVKGGSHLRAYPCTEPPLADNVWVELWEMRRDAMKF